VKPTLPTSWWTSRRGQRGRRRRHDGGVGVPGVTVTLSNVDFDDVSWR